MDARDQHRHIATLQKRWGTDARKDYYYNLNRAKIEEQKGNTILASAYLQEARWDLFWYHRRMGIVNRNTDLGKK
ncbi:MAG: hypothetical protein PHC39_04620 [Proteiniphilum sp.]|nr:hypothetical protein [Proteiniphilum sp.]